MLGLVSRVLKKLPEDGTSMPKHVRV